jgi:SAM-dependent methyltransferase
VTTSVPARHPVARGFDRVAAAYERGRPDYAPEALDFLRRTFHLQRGRTIVELGSGTGKLTRDLRPSRAAIVGVEPSASMRAQFAVVVPDVLAIPGTAEAIPLPDGIADLIVAAQAFHWFRPRATAREMARVLREDGGVALLWNVRDRRHALVRAIDAVVDRHTPRPPRRWERWERAFDPAGSPFRRLRRRRFRRVVPTAPEALVQHTLSVSRVGLLPPAGRRRVELELRALLARHPDARGRAALDLPIVTEVYWTRKRRHPPRARRRSGPTRRTAGTFRPSAPRSRRRDRARVG